MKPTLLLILILLPFLIAQFSVHYPTRPHNVKLYKSKVAQYWTKERMKNAKPLIKKFPRRTKLHHKSSIPKISNDETLGEQVPKDLMRKDPYIKVGKIFFTLDGEDYVCSGSANGKDVVLTAGHCVSDGAGTFVEDLIFVPGYDEGEQPDGEWFAIANKITTFKSWHLGEVFERDVAFVVVDKVNGKTLEQKIGALGIATCEEGNKVTAVGYPADGEYDGEKMIHAIGTIDASDEGTPEPIGMPSKLTEGASGGPWVLNKVNACGVNSYGYDGEDYMYSPYFDQTVFDMRLYTLGEAPDGGIQITKQPQSASIDQMEPIVFSVEATSSLQNESLNYQWLKNDYPIKGATGKSYTIEDPTEDDIGFYSCKVSNSQGWVYSDSAQLSSGTKMGISLFVIFIAIFVMMLNYI